MTDIKRVIEFSKGEFLKYAELTFIDLDEVKDKLDIYIGLNENGDIPLGEKDEIFIDVKGTKGVISGSNAGSVLIAVYRFFIECGCRFLRPGKDGEYINKCNLKGWIVNRINIDNHLDIYASAEEEIKFE